LNFWDKSIAGTGLPCGSPVAAGGTGFSVLCDAGECVALSSFPLPLKVMVHSIGREDDSTSVNRMTAPPLLGICMMADIDSGDFCPEGLSSSGAVWGRAPAKAA
jgi:hypothetical protein